MFTELVFVFAAWFLDSLTHICNGVLFAKYGVYKNPIYFKCNHYNKRIY